MVDTVERLSKVAGDLGLPLSDPKVAEELDRRDEFSSFRSRFLFPKRKDIQETGDDERDAIYLCGNSLGLQPKKTREYVMEELDKWAQIGVEGHFQGKRPWLTIDECVHENMAKLVGALPSEVAIMNGLTVNLHLLLISFYRPTQTRNKIIIEKGAFPSDLYVVNSQAEHHGFKASDVVVQLTPREGEEHLRTEDILSKIKELGDSLAILLLGGVQYYSGQFFDIPTITKAVHDVGAVAAWDLAHAVGNLPLRLHDWEVDFACWCTYKYLNSGPGSIAGAFVHSKHTSPSSSSSSSSSSFSALPRLAGWWGHDLTTRFQMDEPHFIPVNGAFGWRLSNPPVLPVVCLQASLELFIEAGGMEKLREKSLLLTGYLEWLLETELGGRNKGEVKAEEDATSSSSSSSSSASVIEEGKGEVKQNQVMKGEGEVKIITPEDWKQRGCQLSVKFSSEKIKLVTEGLKRRGVVCDLRKPNVIRIAPTPLYNSFQDVWEIVHILKEILTQTSSPSSSSTSSSTTTSSSSSSS